MSEDRKMTAEEVRVLLKEAAAAGAAAALREREDSEREAAEQLAALLKEAEQKAAAREAAWVERVAAAPREVVVAPEDMVLTYQGIRVEVKGGEECEVPAPHAALFRQVMEERMQLEALKRAMAQKGVF